MRMIIAANIQIVIMRAEIPLDTVSLHIHLTINKNEKMYYKNSIQIFKINK
jgi:hypothetical protein